MPGRLLAPFPRVRLNPTEGTSALDGVAITQPAVTWLARELAASLVMAVRVDPRACEVQPILADH